MDAVIIFGRNRITRTDETSKNKDNNENKTINCFWFNEVNLQKQVQPENLQQY